MTAQTKEEHAMTTTTRRAALTALASLPALGPGAAAKPDASAESENIITTAEQWAAMDFRAPEDRRDAHL
jgi:hypothetical protein